MWYESMLWEKLEKLPVYLNTEQLDRFKPGNLHDLEPEPPKPHSIFASVVLYRASQSRSEGIKIKVCLHNEFQLAIQTPVISSYSCFLAIAYLQLVMEIQLLKALE